MPGGLQELDLIHLEECQNYKMSGGEKRTAIATHPCNEPKGNADDEPPLALDPQRTPGDG